MIRVKENRERHGEQRRELKGATERSMESREES